MVNRIINVIENKYRKKDDGLNLWFENKYWKQLHAELKELKQFEESYYVLTSRINDAAATLNNAKLHFVEKENNAYQNQFRLPNKKGE